MTPQAWQVLAGLLAAHFAADFWFQPDWMHRTKRRLDVLLLHGLLHAALVTAYLGVDGLAWIAPAAIFATHVPIDYAKARFGQGSARWFLADQAAHLAILAALAFALPVHLEVEALWSVDVAKVLAVLAGWIATVSGGRYLIGLAVQEFEAARPDPDAGLPQAGRIIGQLERALVFVLVLAGHAAAIGFLIAAKSVFRFGELNAAEERKESEYVIIGTLMSFGFALLVAFATSGLLVLLGAE